MQTHILVVNAGSSSVKLSLFTPKGISLPINDAPAWSSHLDLPTGSSDYASSEALQETVKQAIASALRTAAGRNEIPPLDAINAVGHRIVHGGSLFTEPAPITPKVLEAIRSFSSLAPLHNPLNAAGIEIAAELMPAAKQAAVFDTAFFTTLPQTASTYPGPWEWEKEGIRRYGFHGISHQYNAIRGAEIGKPARHPFRLISCHLGNGASLAAVKDGIAIDTTMGFTPLDGLMMGSRPGALDPGILTYLLLEKNVDGETLSRQLNYGSGLKGISGFTGDMREIIEAKEKGDKRSRLAYDMFIHSLVKNVAAMAASLQGVDMIVFSGGIGENSAQVRNDALRSLEWMGAAADDAANRSNSPDTIISATNSKIPVAVIKSEEDRIIAGDCMRLLQRRLNR